MTDQRYRLYGVIIEMVLVVVLIGMMVWVILSPSSDEIAKAALAIVGTAVGFVLGKETSR